MNELAIIVSGVFETATFLAGGFVIKGFSKFSSSGLKTKKIRTTESTKAVAGAKVQDHPIELSLWC